MMFLIECDNTDLMLKNIRKLCKNNETIKIYAISDISNNISNNIDILNYKNISNYSNNLKSKITRELTYLGYNFAYKGTQYLANVIEYIILNPTKNLDNLEKEIYPKVSNSTHTSVHNMKCNINRATTMMYTTCEIEKLKNYFGFMQDIKPKIKTIINAIVNRVS